MLYSYGTTSSFRTCLSKRMCCTSKGILCVIPLDPCDYIEPILPMCIRSGPTVWTISPLRPNMWAIGKTTIAFTAGSIIYATTNALSVWATPCASPSIQTRELIHRVGLLFLFGIVTVPTSTVACRRFTTLYIGLTNRGSEIHVIGSPLPGSTLPRVCVGLPLETPSAYYA